jgi:hypothetical protein
MKARDYSDDEIRHLRGRILADQQSAPAAPPSPIPKPRSTVGADVSRELSLDEILKKIERGIADSL